MPQTFIERFTAHHELPFESRATEVERLVETYRYAVKNDAPTVVLIRAESGWGKTRLVREVLSTLASQTVTPSASPHSATEKPFAEIVLEAPEVDASIIEMMTLAVRRFAKKYAQGAGGGGNAAPFLAALDDGLKTSPQLLPQLFRRAVRDLALLQPVVFVMEDVHRADEAITKDLSLCIRSIASLPVLFIVTERPPLEPLAAQGFQQTLESRLPVLLDLKPLTAADIKSMLTKLFERSDLDDLAFQLHRYSEGNPYYLTELVHELLDSGAIKPVRGEWQFSSYNFLDSSRSLRFLSERRYQHCTAAEQSLLQQLLLAGDLSAESRFADAASSESLVRKGIITRNGEGQLQFAHALMRDLVRTRISEQEKNVYFASVIDAADDGKPKPCQSSELALYLSKRTTPIGDRATKFLIDYSREQSERFLRHRLAETCLVSVLRCAQTISLPLRAEAMTLLSELEFKLEKFEDGLRLMRELLSAENLAPLQRLEASSMQLRILHYHRRDEFDKELAAVIAYRDAHASGIDKVYRALWDKASLVIDSLTARWHFVAGRYSEAREIYTRLLEHPKFTYNAFPDVAANLSGIEVVFGNPREAERYARLSLEYYSRSGTEIEIAKAEVNLGTVLFQEGKFLETYQALSDAVGRCSLIGVDGRYEKYVYHTALFYLGVTNLRLLNDGEARRQLLRCAEYFRQDKQSQNILQSLLAFAELYLETDEPALADDAINEATIILNQYPHPLFEMYFWFQHARVLLRKRDRSGAAAIIEKMEARAPEKTVSMWTANILQVKGEAALLENHIEAAAGLFGQAATAYSKRALPFDEMMCRHESALAWLSLGSQESMAKAEAEHHRAAELADKMGLEKRALRFRQAIAAHPAMQTALGSSVSLSVTEKSENVSESLGDNTMQFIRVTAFNTLSVFRQGESVPIPKKEWNSERPRKLLLYLLLSHKEPNRRTREAIYSALWDDASTATDPKKLSDLLRVALSHARNAVRPPSVAAEQIIQKSNELYAVNLEYFRVDWMTFGSLVMAGREAQRLGNISAAEDKFLKAKALYTGDLLAEMTDEWIVDKRIRYAEMFDTLLRDLSRCAESRGDYELGLHYINALLARDREREAAYQDAIRLSGLMSDKVQATRFYEACREMMRDEFGLSPSKFTEETYSKYVLSPK